jgi:hypothetical protein
VTGSHLERAAIVYVRQSTLVQVREHTESTLRQYDLAAQAARLGWAGAAVEVIDADLGLSGRTASHRDGFKHLVARVCLGEVGAVFGLEVSRLARSNADLARLLELARLTGTLVIDNDGVYDLSDINDRLLPQLSDLDQLLWSGWPGHDVDDGSLTWHRRGRRGAGQSPGVACAGLRRSASSSPCAAASWALTSASSRRSSVSLAVRVATTLGAAGAPSS